MVTGDVVDLDSRVKLIDFGAGRPRLFSCFSDAYSSNFLFHTFIEVSFHSAYASLLRWPNVYTMGPWRQWWVHLPSWPRKWPR